MRRIFVIAIGWSVVALGVAHGVPARPLYEPAPPPKLVTPAIVDLGGSMWLGKYLTINRYYTFESDGTISYQSAPTVKGFKNRGSWKFGGTNVFFEHHMGAKLVVEFRGTVKDHNTIVGEQTDLRTGAKTIVTMQRNDSGIK